MCELAHWLSAQQQQAFARSKSTRFLQGDTRGLHAVQRFEQLQAQGAPNHNQYIAGILPACKPIPTVGVTPNRGAGLTCWLGQATHPHKIGGQEAVAEQGTQQAPSQRQVD